MRLKPSTYFAIAIMVVMVIVVGNALTFKYFQSALLPVLAGCMVFILAGIQVGKELLGKEAPQVEKKPLFEVPEYEVEGVKASAKIDLKLFCAWFLGFCFATYLLGHLIAVPLFCLFYIRWRGKSWVSALIVGLIIIGALYMIFPVAFRTDLYPGVIPELIFGS